MHRDAPIKENEAPQDASKVVCKVVASSRLSFALPCAFWVLPLALARFHILHVPAPAPVPPAGVPDVPVDPRSGKCDWAVGQLYVANGSRASSILPLIGHRRMQKPGRSFFRSADKKGVGKEGAAIKVAPRDNR